MGKAELPLDNLVSLMRAELKNTPFISSFEGICYDVKRLQRGELFLALNPQDIDEAVRNGAYGIVFDVPTQISDSEIAWLKVSSIDEALVRLLRFTLSQKAVRSYCTDTITLELAKNIIAPSLIVLEGSLQENLKLLFNVTDNDVIIYANVTLFEKLFTATLYVSELETQHSICISEQTLFETSFIYRERFYERLALSALFIESLQRLFNLIDNVQLTFRFKNSLYIPHFVPIFVNKHFKRVEFGQSDNVLIFEENIKLFVDAYHFITQRASWAQRYFICLQSDAALLQNHIKKLLIFDSEDAIINFLKTTRFDFVLMYNIHENFLNHPSFNTAPEQLTLF